MIPEMANTELLRSGKFIARLRDGDLVYFCEQSAADDMVRLHSPRVFIPERAKALRPKFIDVRPDNIIWLGEEGDDRNGEG